VPLSEMFHSEWKALACVIIKCFPIKIFW